jgi:antitoxin ParD1/3/4
MTLNVSLPMELEARVREHVTSGLYGSASEVIREALRLFEAYHAVLQSSLAALKADIDQGMVDVQPARVSKLNMTAINAQARASKKTRLMSQDFLPLSAQTDLLESWSYIADQSVDAADHVLDVIDKEAQTLALQPLMGRARPDLHPDIRYWPKSRLF